MVSSPRRPVAFSRIRLRSRRRALQLTWFDRPGRRSRRLHGGQLCDLMLLPTGTSSAVTLGRATQDIGWSTLNATHATRFTFDGGDDITPISAARMEPAGVRLPAGQRGHDLSSEGRHRRGRARHPCRHEADERPHQLVADGGYVLYTDMSAGRGHIGIFRSALSGNPSSFLVTRFRRVRRSSRPMAAGLRISFRVSPAPPRNLRGAVLASGGSRGKQVAGLSERWNTATVESRRRISSI